MATIVLQRAMKPQMATVAKAIRAETGHKGGIRFKEYRRLPAQYEHPYWEFRYQLES
jgi:hypothetical protein